MGNRKVLAAILAALMFLDMFLPLAQVKAEGAAVYSKGPWRGKASSDGSWKVYVDDRVVADCWTFFSVADEGNYNMVAWVNARSLTERMNGNPDFVMKRITHYRVTDGKTTWDQAYIRELAEHSGADLDWDASAQRVDITPSPKPEGYIDCPDKVKAGEQVTISISGNYYKGNGMEWELSSDEGFIDSGSAKKKLSKNVKYEFEEPGRIELELELTDDFQRTTTVTKRIEVEASGDGGGDDSGLVADFEIAKTAKVGERIFAEDQSYTKSGKITNWTWEVDDTSPGRHPDVEAFEKTGDGAYFTFNKTGKYQVRLTVENSAGDADSLRKFVNVGDGEGGGGEVGGDDDDDDDKKIAPAVNLRINKENFLIGDTAEFTAEVQENDYKITKLTWSIYDPYTGEHFKDGTGIIPKAIVIDMPEGYYGASQIAHYQKGGQEEKAVGAVTFNVFKPESLVADFVADPWEQFVGEPVRLIYKDKTPCKDSWFIKKAGADSYESLSTEPPQSSGSLMVAKFTRNEEGLYDIKLVLTAPNGDQAEAVKQVRFKKRPPLTIDFQAIPAKTQIGNNIKLVNRSTGNILTTEWYIKKAGVSTWDKLYLNPQSEFTRIEVGRYDIKLVIKDDKDQKELIKQVEFTEINDLRAIISAIPPSAYVGQPITIQNNSFGEYSTYQWYVDGRAVDWPRLGTTLTEYTPTTKSIRLEVRDDNGNADSTETTISWQDVSLTAKIAASKTTAIEGDTVYISNNSTGDYDQWNWKVNGQTQTWGKDGGMLIAEEGNTTVSLTIIHSESGVTSTDSVTISAKKPNIPPKAIIIVPNYAIRGEQITIKDLSYDTDGKVVNRKWEITGTDKCASNLKTDGSGGVIAVDEFTTITLRLTVTDNDGATDTDSRQIKIGGNEPPEIKLIESGTKKQNRKYSLDLSESFTGKYYSIDWPRTDYKIVPAESNVAEDSIKFVRNEKGIDLLFKEVGTYSIDATITDTGGRKATGKLEVVIVPDEPPINNVFLQDASVYRNEPVNVIREIGSPDNDIIKTQNVTLYYDSNNDGSFDGETGKDITSTKSLTFDKVGQYKITSYVKEEFGQETIEQFVAEADRRSTTFERVIKVDNRPPSAEIKADIPSKKEKVDLFVMVDSKLDNGSNYYYIRTGRELPNRDYIKNNLTAINNQLAIKNIDSRTFKKDFKTDVYQKDISENHTFHDYSKDENNLPATVSYSDGQGYSGTLSRQPGVTWTTKYVDVTTDFTKYRYKDNYSRTDDIFEDSYYVNEDKTVLVNPSTGYRKNVNFNGNIPRTNVSWQTKYNYSSKDVTETEVKNNNTKDDSVFNSQKWYSQGGYSGSISRKSIVWETNWLNQWLTVTEQQTREVKDIRDSTKVASDIPAPLIYHYGGCSWLLNSLATRIPRTSISWSGPFTSSAYTQHSGWLSDSRSTLDRATPGVSSVVLADLAATAKAVPGSDYWTSDIMEHPNWPNDGYTTREGEKRRFRRRYSFQYTYKYYTANATYRGPAEYKRVQDYTGTATYQGTVTKSTFSHYVGTATYRGNLSTTTTDGFYGEGTYNGTATKYVSDSSQPNWRLESKKYILYVADNNGANNLRELENYQQKTGAKVIFIGNTDYSGAVKNIRYTNLAQNIEEAIEFIAVEEELESRNAVLVNEEAFELETGEDDPENDEITERAFKYEHDENFYLNPEGKSSLPNVWTEYKPTYLDKPGKYIVSYRVKDQAAKDPRFDDYNKYSNIDQVILFGHRRPIVTDFNVNFDYNPSTKKYEDPVFMVEAYDPDYYDTKTHGGRADKGIADYAYKWLKKGESEYRYGIPKELDSGTYVFQVLARDIDDAWSLPFEKEIRLTDMEFILKGVLDPEESKFNLQGIPASEELKVTDIETIHAYPVNSVEFSLYQGGQSKSPVRKLVNPTDIRAKDKSVTLWSQIREYEIPKTLRDGDYVATLTARSSYASASKRQNIKVVTPVNLRVNVPPEIYIDEENRIKATTSKYVDKVTMTFNSKTYNMDRVLAGEENEWQYDLLLPEGFTVGWYTIKITATTPNGNTETKTVQVLVEDPLSIIGDTDKNVYRAGEAIRLTAETEGKAFRVEAHMWYPHNEHTATNTTTLLPNSALSNPPQDIMRWHSKQTRQEGYDLVPIIPMDMPNGTYTVTFTAYKRRADGTHKTATSTKNIKVKGNILNDIVDQIIGPY